MRKALYFLVVFGFFMTILLSACGGEGEEGNTGGSDKGKSSGDKYKIGVLAAEADHGWVAGVAHNAKKRSEELAGEGKIEYKIQTSGNAQDMTSQLDDLVTWGADAIVAYPQWEGMETPIQKAVDDGIVVINFDIEIDVDGIYRLAGDNEDMGVAGAKYIVDKIGTEGNVIALENPPQGSVSDLRMKGFRETMAEIAPDMNIETYATEFKPEIALRDFSDILTSNDHIDAVFSIDDETSIGVLLAIEESKRDDIKVITGGGGMQEYFEMMPKNEDIWIQSALYTPAMIEDSIDMALSVLEGEDVEKKKIIPTTIVDRDNYEEFLDENSPY